MSGPIGSPKQWRDLADEMRVLADETTDAREREVMLRIANDYLRLAEYAAMKVPRKPENQSS